jgi:hypothetical protein
MRKWQDILNNLTIPSLGASVAEAKQLHVSDSHLLTRMVDALFAWVGAHSRRIL